MATHPLQKVCDVRWPWQKVERYLMISRKDFTLIENKIRCDGTNPSISLSENYVTEGFYEEGLIMACFFHPIYAKRLWNTKFQNISEVHPATLHILRAYLSLKLTEICDLEIKSSQQLWKLSATGMLLCSWASHDLQICFLVFLNFKFYLVYL